MLQKAESMASTTLKRTGSIDWAVLSSSVMRMAHCTADELSPILTFVQKYGGGTTTAFVDDVGKFFKAFVKPGRTVVLTVLTSSKGDPRQLDKRPLSTTRLK